MTKFAKIKSSPVFICSQVRKRLINFFRKKKERKISQKKSLNFSLPYKAILNTPYINKNNYFQPEYIENKNEIKSSKIKKKNREHL
jgi:hypothetical protein